MIRNSRQKVFFIVGPTASGKTAVAVAIARRLNAEIISADSMQAYKGLSVLTAAPALRERKQIKHHLVGFKPLEQEYNAAEFVSRAGLLITDIHTRKKVPLIVGGSGLYVSSLLDGIFEGPGQDLNLRTRLKLQAEKKGNLYVYNRLKKLDPHSALNIHPNNLQRVIRALEVCLLSGQKMSELKANRQGLASVYNVKIAGLLPDRQVLYQKIDQRVEQMFEAGLLRQVKTATEKTLSKTALKIIGLEYMLEFIRGSLSLQKAKELIKRDTRHLAKRQITWFKRDRRIHWIQPGEEKDERVPAKVYDFFKRGAGSFSHSKS